MRWLCKLCNFRAATRLALLKHYRLTHILSGHGRSLPCLYSDCPSAFKSLNSLHAHLSRDHCQTKKSGETVSFLCLICNISAFHTERQYFEHIGGHLKRHETVHCVFNNCDYSTNIYSTFASHKSRKHTPHCLQDFKSTLLQTFLTNTEQSDEEDVTLSDENEDVCSETVVEEGDSVKAIIDHLSALLLKLDCIHNIPSKCIDDIVEEIQFISSSASLPVIKNIILDTFKNHNCSPDPKLVTDLMNNICQLSPLNVAFCNGGPLASAYHRKEYIKKHFSVVESLEYILDSKDGKTYQYVPVLQSLSQLLQNCDIVQTIVKNAVSSTSGQYCTFRDGSHFKENAFFASEELRLSLLLYCDDFEICNPLGTSRKKHKVTAIYWVLADIPPVLRSTLSSIYLAVLCKANDVKKYGYSRVLEPLLNDLKNLEENGVFVPSLGKTVKGTVFSVIADNLGAHSLAGFVESFSGSHICRFCVGQRSQFEEAEVRAGVFPLRTKQQHELDIQEALASRSHCHGVKKHCTVTQRLSHFYVTTGYPPDVLHDLLEGIIPLELALSIDIFIKKKYFSLEDLNQIIKQFPYKWKDKTNSPQGVPPNFAARKSIGGNAHENWCLLRLLPFMIGSKVPEQEEAWQLIMTLKDIVELAMSPTHTDESIGYLDSLIAEHRSRFKSVFKVEKLIPKHHFVEHYPQLIKAFGPLVSLWTMRFEAKHHFFKKIVRQTSCFRNVLKSMANKHQSMISYTLYDPDVRKCAITVTKMSSIPIDIANQDIQKYMLKEFPAEKVVHLASKAEYHGTFYSAGMMLAYGSTIGFPDFAEIVQIIVVQSSLAFVVKLQTAWYFEHFRGFMLEPTGIVRVVKHSELIDTYPLVAYVVDGKRMVSLKHHISLSN